MATMGGAACLVTENPEFQAPPELQPFVSNLNPPPSRIIVIPRKPGSVEGENNYVQDTEISFDIHSEDGQKPLYASVWLDLPKPDRIFINCPLLPGTGTLAKARPQRCPLAISSAVAPACHSITVLVSHEPSIAFGRIDGDLATATWWAQIGVNESDSPANYQPCIPDPLPGDAGTDARGDGGAK